MSRQGVAVARAYGERLPRFGTKTAARRALFGERDRALGELRALDGAQILDNTVESLLAIERWYFALVAARGFARLRLARARFEIAMGLYFGVVAVKQGGARWLVEELAFAPGRYELGIEARQLRILGLDGLCTDWHKRQGNKAHRALFREYQQSLMPTPRRRPVPTPTPPELEAAIRRELGRAAGVRSKGLYPWELRDEVRDRLGATKRSLPTAVLDGVIAIMEQRRQLVRIDHGGRGHFSVSLKLA